MGYKNGVRIPLGSVPGFHVAFSSDDAALGSLEKKTSQNMTFPSGFEIGDFEIHLKRNVGATKAPLSNIPPTIAPPIPTKPINESTPVAAAVAPSPPPPPKSSPEKITTFTNVSFGKSSKLLIMSSYLLQWYVMLIECKDPFFENCKSFLCRLTGRAS
ncbi:hypothetical protein SLEP1_g53357 [Rubroshorea leprosula]|uniref:Uncharacterized protein n=1 Tax=Rubroshorea leprosula TaxID=152421 RepID=A0AAV5M954_9ROSI|nr:hypothetical protein SLEP1_g53357 [Rubroshorea leprosula]